MLIKVSFYNLNSRSADAKSLSHNTISTKSLKLAVVQSQMFLKYFKTILIACNKWVAPLIAWETLGPQLSLESQINPKTLISVFDNTIVFLSTHLCSCFDGKHTT